MITKVVIRDNTKSPVRYIADLKNFKNGKEYSFKDGVNIIVGENGCGKTTLLKLIERYLMVDYTECSRGKFNCNINALCPLISNKILDGVDVYADYTKNTFRLSHKGEKERKQALNTFDDFGVFYQQQHSSTGEGVIVSLNYLFNYMFGKKANLTFDYHDQFKDTYPMYVEYVGKHKVECADEWTILMDEPDRNLSLDNISQIKAILTYHKPHTQIIAVVHNPLLIYALAKEDGVNFIEMSEGYIKKVKKEINEIIK
jgi:predicted ATPase